MKLLLLTVVFSVSLFASRFQKPIGSAEVLICRGANQLQSIELIDLYESKVLRKVYPNFQGAGGDFRHMLAMMRDRFPAFDPIRRNMFWQAVENDFFYPSTDTLWLENAEWPVASTAEEMPLPQGCHLKTVAYIQAPKNANEPVYIIDKDTFYKMSDENKAATFAHLILLRDALINYGHKDQLKTRLLVGNLASKNLVKENPDITWQYSNYIRDLSSDYGLEHSPLEVHAAPVNGKQTVFYADADNFMEFYSDGSIVTGKVSGPKGQVAFEMPKVYLCDPKLSEWVHPWPGSHLTFQENGCPYEVKLGSSLNATLYGGKKATFAWDVSFYENGKLEWATPCLLKNEYYNTKGELKNYPSGHKLHFDEEGRVIDI